MENAEEIVKQKWQQLTAFTNKEDLKERLWQELVHRYAEPHRHYHNLNHIGYMFSLLDEHRDKVQNPAIVGFAILYHDVIYDTFRRDNEEESAALTENHLQQLRLNQRHIDVIKAFILATKDHHIADDFAHKDDLALFLDFDMSILGEASEMYRLYSQKIRQEYAKFSDSMYREGRRFALQQMLATTLFHSSVFKDREAKAKMNMEAEMKEV